MARFRPSQIQARHEVHPGQIQAWKKSLLEGASSIFGGNHDKGQKAEEVLIARWYRQIGLLKVERDFLAGRSGP